MANVQLVAQIRVRWWLRAYLAGVVIFARLAGLEPDWQKVSRWMSAGIAVRVIQQ